MQQNTGYCHLTYELFIRLPYLCGPSNSSHCKSIDDDDDDDDDDDINMDG